MSTPTDADDEVLRVAAYASTVALDIAKDRYDRAWHAYHECCMAREEQ